MQNSAQIQQLPKQLLLTVKQSLDFLNVSRTLFYALAKRPDFPRPVCFGTRKGIRYVASDLIDFARSRQVSTEN